MTTNRQSIYRALANARLDIDSTLDLEPVYLPSIARRLNLDLLTITKACQLKSCRLINGLAGNYALVSHRESLITLSNPVR